MATVPKPVEAASLDCRRFRCVRAIGVMLPFWLGATVPALAGDPSGQFYAPESVQAIHLEVKPEDLERMDRALPQRINVPATFRWNEQVFKKVGVRYKGNSSSMPNSPFKRGYLISFSEYKKGQRFLGLRHVALDNGIQFGSLFSERLITDVLRGLGVKASRCNYAQLYLNGKSIGVYVNVERIDKSFLERNFGTDQGVLFKVDEGGPGTDFHFVGNDLAIYHKNFELHSGKESEGYPRLLEFIRGVDSPAPDRGKLSKSLDVEAFLKTTAVMLFAGNFDQYTGWGPHNYYLYQDPRNQRWTYIPWDLDVGFADHAFGQVSVLDGWDAAWPAPIPGRPLMEWIVSDPVMLKRYREQARAILDTWFEPNVLIPRLRAEFARIQPALKEDPYPPRRATVPSDSGYQDMLSSMEDFIRKRYAMARAQLDSPGNRPQSKPMSPGPNQEGPTPGPPSPDAPRDLHVVSATASSVELGWTDHAEGAMAYIVQRCTGAECVDFVNAIGQGGQNITMAMDRNVRPGMILRYRVYAVLPTPQGPHGTGVSNAITISIPESENGQGKSGQPGLPEPQKER
jgi:CotH kinase protein